MLSSSLLESWIDEKVFENGEFPGGSFIGDSCFVCGRKSLFTSKSPNYGRNTALISSRSSDLLNFLGISYEEAVTKGTKVHNQRRYEGSSKAQFSCDWAFRDRCSFQRKMPVRKKTPITRDVPTIESNENKLLNPEIGQMKQVYIQKQELEKYFLHLNDLFGEGVPFAKVGLTNCISWSKVFISVHLCS